MTWELVMWQVCNMVRSQKALLILATLSLFIYPASSFSQEQDKTPEQQITEYLSLAEKEPYYDKAIDYVNKALLIKSSTRGIDDQYRTMAAEAQEEVEARPIDNLIIALKKAFNKSPYIKLLNDFDDTASLEALGAFLSLGLDYAIASKAKIEDYVLVKETDFTVEDQKWIINEKDYPLLCRIIIGLPMNSYYDGLLYQVTLLIKELEQDPVNNAAIITKLRRDVTKVQALLILNNSKIGGQDVVDFFATTYTPTEIALKDPADVSVKDKLIETVSLNVFLPDYLGKTSDLENALKTLDAIRKP